MPTRYTAFPSEEDRRRSRPPRVEGVGPTPEEACVGYYDFDAMHVLGTFQHEVAVSLERMIENVLDWEHFPHIHPDDFTSAELVDEGPGFFRARFGTRSGVPSQVATTVHPSEEEWVFAFETGTNQGLIIHQRARRVAEHRIAVRLTFYTRDAPRNKALGQALFDVYRRRLAFLYDQDAVMMRERQQAIDRRRARVTDTSGVLGSVEEVAARAPFQVTVRGQRYWITVEEGEVRAHGAECPHMFGPLPCPAGEDTERVCPWHGYRFGVATGESTDGRRLRTARPPQLERVDGQVVLRVP